MIFSYHPEIIERYPEICAGVILAQGVQNRLSPEPLKAAFLQEQQSVLARLGDSPLSEVESLAAWRAAFRLFGVNPTKYRCAAEALLRRLTKKGDIPSINALVDICNLVSIRHALPVAAFDTRGLEGGITVHFAQGDERFTPLFEEQIEHPESGEVVFSDPTSLVVARRWCWRQSEESAAREDSSEVLVTIEAQHAGSRPAIEAGVGELLELLAEYVGGSYTSALLDARQPSFPE